jgi:hypothetical protein
VIATAMRTACDCVVCVEQVVAISHVSDVQPWQLVTRTHTRTNEQAQLQFWHREKNTHASDRV